MTWTKKHSKFALSVNLSESEKLILQDILCKAKRSEPSEIEIDLRQTNKWIGKERWEGEYHRTTLVRAIAALDEKTMGAVVIMKKYNPYVYKLIVRPHFIVKKLGSAKCTDTHKPTTGEPMYSEEHKKRLAQQQQQNISISKIDSVLRTIGLKYTPDNLLRIWRMSGKSIAEVQRVVEYAIYAHNTQSKPIRNAHGFIMECLKCGWHKTFDLLYSPELPKFESVRDIAVYVDKIFRGDKLCPE